ncbi:MAG: hypothetical protein E7374_00110 [Clostridiales bacterium]|nr:hypothetical protein [Clostridiales bacterium]
MEILGLKLKSKRNANVFVAVTNDEEYLLASDIIVKNGLSVGEIDDDLFFKSVKESENLIAYNMALKYINSNVKTEKQIKDYLYKKEFKKDTIDEVVFKLKDYGIINDKIFSDMYVRSNPNFSKNKVKQKLASFGVKGDTLDESVEGIDDDESCLNNARKFFKNKEKTKENCDKLIRRLLSMGYRWDTVKHTLNLLNLETEED